MIKQAVPLLHTSRRFFSTPHRRGIYALQDVTIPGPFYPAHGGELRDVTLRVECVGDASLPRCKTIVVFPSFSHSSHVAATTDDPSPGWWSDMVRPGGPIDTRLWRVLCVSPLGSPFSLTNPSRSRGADGKPLRLRFPTLTPSDLARAAAGALGVLGCGVGADAPPGARPLRALIGASLGGMQALQFASIFPGAAERVCTVSTTGRTTPFTVAVRHMQRASILNDPDWRNGDYEDAGVAPSKGLALARELGTLFYRSRSEFDSRFSWGVKGANLPGAADLSHATPSWSRLNNWEVESYLTYAGKKFVYDANSYLLLSVAMDLHDLGDGAAGRSSFADGAACIAAGGATRALLVGVSQDTLIPAQESKCLADAINAAVPGSAEYMELDSPLGHDAFLKPKEVPALGDAITAFIEEKT